jgi:3-hydroxybutyryl-CoA dehydrogenase
VSRRYAVVGSGYMGGGIAQVLALSGATVAIADVSADVAERNYQRLLAESRQFVADQLFPPGATETLESNLRVATSIQEAAAQAEFIEEAIPEAAALKREILAAISAHASPSAIIATNTSTISIGTLAKAVTGPERFLGVHFSNPAPFVPGVELIAHAGTRPSVLAAVRDVLAPTGKQCAEVKDVTGFVLNRLQYALFHEATELVAEGVASPRDIDTVVRTTFGFRLPFFGPFAIADMAGLDVYAFCYQSLQTRFPERFATPPVLADLVDEGRLGAKTGGGFFDVPADRVADLVAYRNKAYVALQKLLDELGPAPI